MTGARGDILFLAHRIPFPPDRGDKIRSHHILKALAQFAPVHVGTLADDEADHESETELALVATSYHLARRTRPLAAAGIEALARGKPVSLTAFDDRGLRDWVARTVRNQRIAAIYVFSSQMAQFVPSDFAGRIVMDFVDVDSAKFDAYAAQARWPMRWIHAREGRLLAEWEARIARRAETSVFVTPEEAALFRSRVDADTLGASEIRALCNGIDCSHWSPALVTKEARLTAREGPHLMFSGQMDYPPNVAAATRFATRIMPEIRSRHPRAEFHIVGRNPVREVMALEGIAGTRVWGGVPDMRPWLAAANVVVAPLEIARGIQNKVLEAMAMARPVVVSPDAATGIAARDGVEFAIADSDAAFVAQSLELLGDPERRRSIGRAARHYVADRQSWQRMLAELPKIVGSGSTASRHAA